MKKIIYPILKLCVVTLALAQTPQANSADSQTASQYSKDTYVSVGNLCEYIGTIQTDDNGGKNFCSLLPTLTLNLDYFVKPNLAITPQFGATLPQSGRDDKISRMSLFGLLNAKYKTQYLNFIGGTGLYITRVWGPGGEQLLNNGSGTDSFPLPSEAVYSRNLIINLGVSADFSPTISAELYTYIFNALDKDKKDRSLSAGLSLSYHFGEIL
jgi:hypothetical protein